MFTAASFVTKKIVSNHKQKPDKISCHYQGCLRFEAFTKKLLEVTSLSAVGEIINQFKMEERENNSKEIPVNKPFLNAQQI